jgi:hypothetical protein
VSTSSLLAGTKVGHGIDYGIRESGLRAVEIGETARPLEQIVRDGGKTHKPESNPLGPTPPLGGGQTAPENDVDVTES